MVVGSEPEYTYFGIVQTVQNICWMFRCLKSPSYSKHLTKGRAMDGFEGLDKHKIGFTISQASAKRNRLFCLNNLIN